jgi:hypothetical protein
MLGDIARSLGLVPFVFHDKELRMLLPSVNHATRPPAAGQAGTP